LFTFIFFYYCAQSDRLFPLIGTCIVKKWCEKRVTESAQAAKNAELEVLTMLQTKKITELQAAYVDLQCEKDKMKLAEAHVDLFSVTEG
jgi:hypothetical protein